MAENQTTVPAIIDDVRRIVRAIAESARNSERTTGLTTPQFCTLRIIHGASPLSVSQLAQRMGLHPATVVGILDRLECKRLLTRARSKQDRRVVQLTLTGRGKRLVDGSPEVVDAMLTSGLKNLSERQLECVGEGVRLIARLLGPGRTENVPEHRETGR